MTGSPAAAALVISTAMAAAAGDGGRLVLRSQRRSALNAPRTTFSRALVCSGSRMTRCWPGGARVWVATTSPAADTTSMVVAPTRWRTVTVASITDGGVEYEFPS